MKLKMLCSVVLGASALLTALPTHAQDDMESDKKFLMTAGESDLAEITQSKLALEKTANPQIKAYAEKMIADHNMLEDKMKPFAQKMGVPPPDGLKPEHQAEVDKLTALSGTEFDTEYVKSMDKDHHLALMAFDAELGTTKMSTESPFITTVTAGEKVVAMHTKMADKLMKEMHLPEYDPTTL